MSDTPGLADLPALPRDVEGPVFRAPWEAQVFAMTLRLFEAGHFTWREWAERLSAEIAAAGQRGDPGLGPTYYEHWLAAFEKIVTEKGLLRPDELASRKAAWEIAARDTPPGQPIELRPGA
ncbi:MAG: nitrile hydratase accessory protein [Candidatus Rokuibacteriota bacterium]